MEQQLKGKVAIVTGSASGIGASVALGLARRGADVVVNYSRNEKDAKDVAEQVKAAGARAILVQADVAKDEDCRKLADAAMKAWGRI
ncbi:MAG TPA: SDR family NAD(P)-dependent oxidoreductase, partial [Rhizomicrobium sp.]